MKVEIIMNRAAAGLTKHEPTQRVPARARQICTFLLAGMLALVFSVSAPLSALAATVTTQEPIPMSGTGAASYPALWTFLAAASFVLLGMHVTGLCKNQQDAIYLSKKH